MKKAYQLLILSSLAVLLASCSSKEKVTQETTSVTHQSSSSQSTTVVETEESSTSEATTAESIKTSMSLEGIISGDFSSISGIWQNAQGHSLVFDENGLVGDYVTRVNSESPEDGMLTVSVGLKSGVGGFAISLIPAGVTAPIGIDEQGDSSDISRDRMIAGHQYLVSDPDLFFYKVD